MIWFVEEKMFDGRWSPRLPDGRIRMQGDAWSDVITQEQLPGKITFYEAMAEKYGKRTPSYADTAKQLNEVRDG